jgi:hypothetical protein
VPLLPPECTCIEVPDAPQNCAEAADSTCTPELSCDTITVRCPRPGVDLYSCESEAAYAEEALRCALTLLVERTPGRFDISAETSQCGFEGCIYELRDIVVTADGRAVVRACDQIPINDSESETSVRTLAEPAYFTACLEMASPAQQYDCMLAGLRDPVDAC